jgi:hypothetical protein
MDKLLCKHESEHIRQTFGEVWTGVAINHSTNSYLIEPDAVYLSGISQSEFLIDPCDSDHGEFIWTT